jgi:endonuclease/exonuclease/phosphatase family metal-dependent hydrolase
MKKSKTDAVSPRRRRGAISLAISRKALLALAVILFSSCSPPSCISRTGNPHTVLRILGYNVQNLFDDRDDGGEYAEFTKAGGWSRSDYYRRLERLDEAIRLASDNRLPDLIVLAEVENAGVGETLAREFLRRYRWIVADPDGGGTTGVVVLSRREPREVRTHLAVAVALAGGSAVPHGNDPQFFSGAGAGAGAVVVRWESRALVEAVLDLDDAPLRLFAAHWKSQSGGEAATEPRRRMEARLFLTASGADRALPTDGEVLLIGDLNEDLEEYRQHGGSYRTALMHVDDRRQAATSTARPETGTMPGAGNAIAPPLPERTAAEGVRFVYAEQADSAPRGAFQTGWLRSAGVASGARGSYAFRGEWERLDHAFLRLPSRLAVDLSPVVAPSLLRDGVPDRYDPRTGYGISDHLPVMITLSKRPSQ